MNELPEPQVDTLESEIKVFANTLPYWAKFLADKILSGSNIDVNEINLSYNYLLESLNIIPTSEKVEIDINYDSSNSNYYKPDLIFSKIENIEGVNALAENQTLKFCSNVTVIYGLNGSGKSGYTRLLKKVFYSKAPEDILHNIHNENTPKNIGATFTFNTSGNNLCLKYPDDISNPAFKQFSVFDGKCVIKHLDQKNQFEFRPAGLNFFSELTELVKQIEAKLNSEIRIKQTNQNFADLFDGDSDIKNLIQGLSSNTNIEDLKQYLPFSLHDTEEKIRIEKEYDNLLLAVRSKENEIKKLETVKRLLISNKEQIINLNKYFSDEALIKINNQITDFLEKDSLAKIEGLGSFKSENIDGIGTTEWKQFIIAAQRFAELRQSEDSIYPVNGDECIFCNQKLSGEAQALILNYWKFVKSVVEQNAIDAENTLQLTKAAFDKLNFELFSDDSLLIVWLLENEPTFLEKLKQSVCQQKEVSAILAAAIEKRFVTQQESFIVEILEHDRIITSIDIDIQAFHDDSQSIKLKELLAKRTKLYHKEKLEQRFPDIEDYLDKLIWLKNAGKVNWGKRNITDTEKALSGKYFNEKYIETFNTECSLLNGNFGVCITHTGAGGTSFKQLNLKGKSPSAVLSDGEQKVIAISDFLSEMQLSEINRGIIFDDPINSLDNERKKQIAERLIKEGLKKQVIIFTHDLVFFYHLKNYSKTHLGSISDSFKHHSLEKEQDAVCGKVILDNSPANEGNYHEPKKAEEWLSKSKKATETERNDYAKAGLSSLRASYEALAIFTIIGGTVQRFDPQIRMGRLKDIKYDKALIHRVVEKHGEISDLIEAHLQSDEYGITATPEILEQNIVEFKKLKELLRQL